MIAQLCFEPSDVSLAVSPLLLRIPTLPRSPPPAPLTTLDLLFKLDAWKSPGLTVSQMGEMLALCDGCKLYMTKQAHTRHNCEESAVGSAFITVIEDSDTEMEDAT